MPRFRRSPCRGFGDHVRLNSAANHIQDKNKNVGDYKGADQVLMTSLGAVWVGGLVAVGVGTYFIIKKPKAERATAFFPIVSPDALGAAVVGHF